MKSRHLILFFIVIALWSMGVQSLSAQETACESGTDYAELGATLRASGDYSGAVDAYYCVLEADPLNTAFLLERGENALLAGRYLYSWHPYDVLATYFHDVLATRLTELTEQVAANPDDLNALLLFVPTSNYVIEPEEYTENVHTLLERFPDHAFANILQGEALLAMQDDFEAARPYYQRALELASDNAHVWGWVGNDYAAAGDLDAALEYLDTAITLSPSTAMFYQIQSETLFSDVGDQPASVEPAQNAVDLDPNNWLMIVNLVYFLNEAELTAYEDTVPLLDRLGTLLPQGTRIVSFIQALGYNKIGDTPNAAEAIARYAELNPDFVVDGEMLTLDLPVEGEMAYGRVLHYTFEATAGQRVSVRVYDVDQEVNPILAAVAPDGTGMAMSSDFGTGDIDYETSVTFTAPDDGIYTLLVSHSGSSPDGTLETALELHMGE